MNEEGDRNNMDSTFTLQPERVASFEAAGWKAYYDRKWVKMLRLLVLLCQEQFHIPFPQSLLAAFYTTRASLAWVPVEHDEHTARVDAAEDLRRIVRPARRSGWKRPPRGPLAARPAGRPCLKASARRPKGARPGYG